MNRPQFEIDEWYHCFNRGIDKRVVFNTKRDYEHFLELLYVTNSDTKINLSDFKLHSHSEIFKIPRGNPYVAIGAYCLMSNHFHLILKERTEGGITSFMRKLGTAYTMYFNIKNERTGNLFMKPFRSRHVRDDRYFQHVVSYIHLNPAEIFEPNWRGGIAGNIDKVQESVARFPYSSYPHYLKIESPESAILDEEVFSIVRSSSPQQTLREAQEYYLEHAEKE